MASTAISLQAKAKRDNPKRQDRVRREKPQRKTGDTRARRRKRKGAFGGTGADRGATLNAYAAARNARAKVQKMRLL